MFEFLSKLFDTQDFPARWHCGTWAPAHGWLHIISDLAIWAAYTAIPLVIAFLVRRRRDVPFPRVFWLFALFIFACGTTHVLEAIIFWHPLYRLAGVVKVVTAVASWATVAALIMVAPQALRLPGLDKLNEQMRREIEERRLAEQSAQETAARLKALVEAAVDGIITIDEKGVIETINPAVIRLFGYSHEELIGRNVSMLMPEPERSEHDGYLANYARTGHAKVIGIGREVVGRRKDGSLIPFELSVSQVRLEGRTVYSGIVRDISERKQAEREREALLDSERAARGEAERANRAKDEFLQVISHELRNPLSAIVGYTQLLQSGKIPEGETDRALDAVRRNANVQVQLIEDLLDMSRITAGKIRLDMRSVSLSDIVEAAIETVTPSAKAREVMVHKNLDRRAGPVLGDFDRLQQVIWNLLSNGVKFTPRGGRVEVSLVRLEAHVEVRVSDSGEGISPDFLPYVFDRFRQAEGVTKRRHGGLGLGLAIVKHLVELHGGTVQVRSPGELEGATFSVTLPIQSARKEMADSDSQQHTQQGLGRVPETLDLEGLRVLVVDDDADAREIVRVILRDRKAVVFTAASADEALVAFDHDRPDIVLSDIGMPEMDGYELIKVIRRRNPAEGGAVPAVALTAFARREDRTRAMLAGYQAHLTKPVDPVELVAVIASLSGRIAHE